MNGISKMKREFCIILLLFATVGLAQHEEVVLKGAEQWAAAMEKKKWKKVIALTHPKIVEMAGEEEAMLRQAEASDINFKRQEFAIEKIELSEPLNEVQSGEYLMSVVPVRITFQGPLGKVYSESSFLAVSGDGGVRWYYISMSQISMEELLTIFPDMSPDLAFPVKRVYQEE